MIPRIDRVAATTFEIRLSIPLNANFHIRTDKLFQKKCSTCRSGAPLFD
ncbi:hypothetical protein QUA56_05975 [Microcoleus sp. N3A4]